ncbi:transcriptional regulator [Rhizocola hellebori]|uniref:Transcriptional regulator n=1 Tax=Rhizocola hellebori TaxID=1392758 RepID=A0A8J3QGU6_9ACTN|nr:helix-turn-helix transcriptional regulator [Rhizocola hellebori]GIH09470.1 transcriptional regulator [Rhizocola hellebori]
MSDVGVLLKQWRRSRRLSQLALSAEAAVSLRHLCFIETGRARPSRVMVLRLADALDVPLRERNALLLAAGFAPAYQESPMDAPVLTAIRRALDAILAQQEPYPAVVMDRGWNIQHTNDAATRLFNLLNAGHKTGPPGPPNVLRTMLHPDGVMRYVANWPEVAATLLRRIRREAVGGSTDERAQALLAEVLAYPGMPQPPAGPDEGPQLPIIPVQFEGDGYSFTYFSTVTTLGTAQDVTLEELRIELFHPADQQTRHAAEALRDTAP